MNLPSQSPLPTTSRPPSVAVVGWLFIVTGAVGTVYHAMDLKLQNLFEYDLLWITFVRLLAVIGGVFLLRGMNWARGLLLAWIGYHVILSIFHSPIELIIHCVIFVGVTYVLLRPRAASYFQTIKSSRGHFISP